MGGVNNRLIGQSGEVITIESDIQHSDRRTIAFNLLNSICNPLGHGDASGTDSHQNNVLYSVILLYNLMSNTHQGTTYGILVHQCVLYIHFLHVFHLQ